MEQSYLMNYGQILTLFMVMLGPFRLLVPYVNRTRELPLISVRKLAASATLIAIITLVIGALLGKSTMSKWSIDAPILMLAGGIVFFLSVIKSLAFPGPEQVTQAKSTPPTPAEVGLNLIITPWGMTAVILLIAISHDTERTLGVFGVLAVIMILDFVFMIFGRQILKFVGALPLQILNKALGVLQLALSIQLIYNSIVLLRAE